LMLTLSVFVSLIFAAVRALLLLIASLIKP
jgi:hypothetical protein